MLEMVSRKAAFITVIIVDDGASRPLSTTAQTGETRAVGVSREAVTCIVMSTGVKEATYAHFAPLARPAARFILGFRVGAFFLNLNCPFRVPL